MRTFKLFLKEEQEAFGKLKHLQHVEDAILTHGHEGFHKAIQHLKNAHDFVNTGHSEGKITTKYDGSPSIVFGHHPATGKFFVATKSAFNKNPKLNYSESDIEEHHGHAPGLVTKLKEALKHLPKVAPKHGIYQGDMMYGHGDVGETDGKHHFTPNTITYSAEKDSPEGKKIAKSKLGIVVHTKYHGNRFEDMNAGFDPDLHNFKHHSDVNVINHEVDNGKVHHSEADHKKFMHHIEQAKKVYARSHHDVFHIASHPKEHMDTYINKTSQAGTKPTAEGFREHVRERYQNKIEKLKSAKGKLKAHEEMANHLQHIEQNKEHYNNMFSMHHHLQQAKNALVSSLSTGEKFQHHVGSQRTAPEGFVSIHRGQPAKLVNRKEFSKLNTLMGGVKRLKTQNK